MKKFYCAIFAALLLALCTMARAELAITEVVSKNVTLRLDESGQAHDYAVLTNMGEDDMQMGGYTLTDGGSDAYMFDDAVLKPGESVTVFCTGNKQGAPFKLSAEGETLFLYDASGSLAQELSVPAMTYNQRYCQGVVLDGNGGEKSGLYISELLAVNTLIPVDGETPDCIELHNRSGKELELKGYGLSDRPDKPGKWVFPDTMIPAGGYIAVYLNDDTTGFELSSSGECVLLTGPDGNTLDFAAFGPQRNDVSLAYENGSWQETWTPSPGKPNVITNKAAYEQTVFDQNTAGLYISEVLASNGTFDDNGNTYDYIELYNGTKKGIRLMDYYLSDDILNPNKWAFPKGATLPAGGYAVVYMAGRELESSRPHTYYAPFKIEKTNGIVLLCSGQGVQDHVSLGRQYGNIAYGRVSGQGIFSFLERQTPRAGNPAEGYLSRAGDVAIQPAGGLVDAPLTVILSADRDTVIRYTLDGSTPTDESPEYKRPIDISANAVIRARAFADGMLPSNVSSESYLYGVHVSVPVVSLITDWKYLTDPGMGLFVKGYGSIPNYYQKWEYPMHVQYFENGKTLISQLASFHTTGAFGLTRPQKTISIFARGALGEDTFRFSPFPNRDYGTYNALTLRSGGTESRGTRFKDELLTSLAEGLNVMYQDAVPVVVYINGEYWGHYNLREKINQDSIAQWEGISDEKVIDGITILRSRGSVVKGSRDDMEELIQFCRREDLNEPDNLQYVLDRLDVMSYFDHAILEIVSGNTDMQNVRYYRVPGGKWKLALFDMDGSMDNTVRTPLNLYMTRITGKMDKFYYEPFAALVRVPAMRDLFLTRFGEILHDKFLAVSLYQKVDDWAGVIGPLMEDHVKRWPDTSMKRWQSCVDRLRTNLKERPVIMVEYVKKAFRLTDEQVQKYFGAFLDENK